MIDKKLAKLEKNRNLEKNTNFVKKLNNYAYKAIENCENLVTALLTIEEKTEGLDQAILNKFLLLGRFHSKVIRSDQIKKIESMNNSLSYYEKAKEHIGRIRKENRTIPEIEEQSRICEEMCELVPINISRLNAQLHKKKK